MKTLLTSIFLLANYFSFAQHFKEDKKLSKAIANIVAECKLDSAYNVQESRPAYVGVAIIPLHKKNTIGGVQYKNFIYPASMYKLYVAMEILKQVNEQKIDLYKPYEVSKPNDVDRSKEIVLDPRPLLKAGDTVNVQYLLDLMITRSDNTAANCLIDIANRRNINKTIDSLGWKGSDVTRKFLSRKWEEPGYDTIRGTLTSPLHFADLLYRIANKKIISEKLSLQLKALLSLQLDKSKLASGFPSTAMYSHKTGWWSYYTHDAGIVEDGKLKYVIAVFTPVKEENMNDRMKLLAQKIHAMMKRY